MNSLTKKSLFVFLFFLLFSIALDIPAAINRIQGNNNCRVTVFLKYDKYLSARPTWIFLKKEKEWYDELEELNKNQIRAYRNDEHIYRFCDLKSGRYWLGFSIKYLGKRKNKENNWITFDFEYIEPEITTGDYEPQSDTNEIELRRGKSVHIELELKIRFIKRFSGKDDPDNYCKIVDRGETIPEGAGEMLDENFFFMGLGVFQNVEKKISQKKKDFYKITFVFDVFDDYLDTIKRK